MRYNYKLKQIKYDDQFYLNKHFNRIKVLTACCCVVNFIQKCILKFQRFSYLYTPPYYRSIYNIKSNILSSISTIVRYLP